MIKLSISLSICSLYLYFTPADHRYLVFAGVYLVTYSLILAPLIGEPLFSLSGFMCTAVQTCFNLSSPDRVTRLLNYICDPAFVQLNDSVHETVPITRLTKPLVTSSYRQDQQVRSTFSLHCSIKNSFISLLNSI